jgi:hypothetical protein
MRPSLVTLGLGLGLGLAGSAAAQPAPPPMQPACTVELLRVPDDVRPVIEEWVAAEARCAVKLSVRVIPTDGGLYLIATDPSGAMRERLVPDATTAGVLIASWAADDGSLYGGTPARQPAAPGPTPAPAAPGPDIVDALATTSPPIAVVPSAGLGMAPAAPGAYRGPGSYELADTAPTPLAQTPRRTRLATALLTSRNFSDVGIRVDADLKRFWRLELGALAGYNQTIEGHYTGDNAYSVPIQDFLLGGQAAVEGRLWRLGLRLTVGGGVSLTRISYNGDSGMMASPFMSTTLTASVSVTRRVDVRFGLENLIFSQEYAIGQLIYDRAWEPNLLLGIGYRR